MPKAPKKLHKLEEDRYLKMHGDVLIFQSLDTGEWLAMIKKQIAHDAFRVTHIYGPSQTLVKDAALAFLRGTSHE